MVPALTALAAQDEGKVLRIHQPVYPDVVDPQKSSFANEIDILALAYEGLTRLDTNQETVPGRGRVVGVQRRRHPDHLPPARRSQVQRRLAADRGELPLRRRAHLRPGHRRRVPVDPLRDRRLRRVRRARTRRGGQRPGVHAGGARSGTSGARRTRARRPDAADRPDQSGALLPHRRLHVGLLPGQEGDRGRKTRTTGGRRPRTTSATGRSRSPASTRTSSGPSPPTRTTGRDGPSSTASSIVYIEDAAVALEAYRAGDLDIVQLEPPQIPEVQADPELSEAVRVIPDRLDLQLDHEPQPGAIQRPEGARGVRLRLRPRDLLRRSPLRRLHADSVLDPARSPRRHRNRQVRLRSRSGGAGAGRVVLRRSGKPARDRMPTTTATLRRDRASGVDGRSVPRHPRHRAHPRADRRHDADRADEGQRHPSAARACSAAGSRTTPIRRTG